MITVEQIKAARAMLNINQKELSRISEVSIATINNIERKAQTDPKVSTLKAIQGALELKGIEFINESDGRTGLFLIRSNRNLDNALILIIDDSQSDRELYKNWLSKVEGKNYRIIEADNARAGIEAFNHYQPDCMILDFLMYGTDGFQLLASLKKDHMRLPPIIFVTGVQDDTLEDSAMSQGIHTFLNKNTMISEDLQDAVQKALS